MPNPTAARIDALRARAAAGIAYRRAIRRENEIRNAPPRAGYALAVTAAAIRTDAARTAFAFASIRAPRRRAGIVVR